MKEEGKSVSALMERCRHALEAAWDVVDRNHVLTAVNRAYYAAYYAARAALRAKGEAPRTHKGVQSRFAYHFVRTGAVDRDIARILAEAERDRLEADYDEFSIFDRNAAIDLINDVERFVEAVQGLLDSGEI